MTKLTGECRCCRKPIDRSRLACPEHWRMLPQPLRNAISQTYQGRDLRAYVKNIEEADRLWKSAGIWKPGVPMSVRADRGVNALTAALENRHD